MSTLTDEILRRRTFATISHPDAGKTTLTEKLLLFGGAIQLAGEVRARGERRRVRSDWMAVERERGISVSSAVMSFEHEGLAFNLLDTPGHQDFSEDTYRTLTALTPASGLSAWGAIFSVPMTCSPMRSDYSSGVPDRVAEPSAAMGLDNLKHCRFYQAKFRERAQPAEQRGGAGRSPSKLC
jgi:hypothetical protein